MGCFSLPVVRGWQVFVDESLPVAATVGKDQRAGFDKAPEIFLY